MATQTTIPDGNISAAQTFQVERVSVASDGTQGNLNSFEPAISANGRYVTYGSRASNLVPGDTNGAEDIFVFDRKTDTTERLSVTSDGTQANDDGPVANSGVGRTMGWADPSFTLC